MPEAVSTRWLISPGCRANAASSNSFCISPFAKKPLSQPKKNYQYTPAVVWQGDGTDGIQIAPHSSTAAVALASSQVGKTQLTGPDTRLELKDHGLCFLLGSHDLRLGRRGGRQLIPASRLSARWGVSPLSRSLVCDSHYASPVDEHIESCPAAYRLMASKVRTWRSCRPCTA